MAFHAMNVNRIAAPPAENPGSAINHTTPAAAIAPLPGYAPVFPECSLQDLELRPVREALDLILTGHEPYPAMVVDRGWNVVAANSTMRAISALIDPAILTHPVNAMRVGLHPRGLAQWVTNLGQVHAYFTTRLERQVATTGDPTLAALLAEVAEYPRPEYHPDPVSDATAGHILTPTIQFRTPDGAELQQRAARRHDPQLRRQVHDHLLGQGVDATDAGALHLHHQLAPGAGHRRDTRGRAEADGGLQFIGALAGL
jgi:MmyB-like transcription regulator ligand binding domain